MHHTLRAQIGRERLKYRSFKLYRQISVGWRSGICRSKKFASQLNDWDKPMTTTLLDVVPLTIFTFIYNFIYNFCIYRKNQTECKLENSKFHRIHLNPSIIAHEIYLNWNKHLNLLPSQWANTQHKIPFGISFQRIL